MRIDSFQNIPAVLQSLNAQKAIKSTREIEERPSSVTLSSFAETLQALQREAGKSTAARADRVDHLSQQEQSGRLNIQTEKLAENLVDGRIINFKG
ncbi:MAG TPA: flagellar biosynthesis anti-sigma factor FlgM [bacterium]|nr:flagellar biosynthesis anti-sigma factor FlgM [bacterium]